ncbi:MAG: right-handed parallel beta-helix repeat-containing protein [Candidatus Eisenbacteria bacterium]
MLLSEGGRDVTTIDCEGAYRGFVFQNGESRAAVVDGFTIDDARAPNAPGEEFRGGGALIDGASPTFLRCRFVRCGPGDDGLDTAGSLFATNGSVRLAECEILQSDGGFEGNGASTVLVYGGLIEDCLFRDCVGAAAVYSGSEVLRCRFLSNYALDRAAALAAYQSNVKDCEFRNNTTESFFGSAPAFGGAVVVSSSTVTDCRFTQNRVEGYGGALGASNGAVVSRCEFRANTAGFFFFGAPDYGGGAVCCLGTSVVDRCLFSGNVAYARGGALLTRNGVTQATQCTFAANEANSFGVPGRGGALSIDGGTLLVERSIIWDNCADVSANTAWVGTGASLSIDCADLSELDFDGPGTWTLGSDVFTEDPFFCAPLTCTSAPTEGGDYGLASNSPCIAPDNGCAPFLGAFEGSACSAVGACCLPDLQCQILSEDDCFDRGYFQGSASRANPTPVIPHPRISILPSARACPCWGIPHPATWSSRSTQPRPDLRRFGSTTLPAARSIDCNTIYPRGATKSSGDDRI